MATISQREDKPQPKRLTGENRANREGNDWEFLFSFLNSVCPVVSVLKIFAFFCKDITCNRLRQFSGKLKTGAFQAASENKFFQRLEKPNCKSFIRWVFQSVGDLKLRIFF